MSSPTFFDFFQRPEQVIRGLYTDHLGASVGGDEEARKFQTLFGDSFGHHVGVYLDAAPQLVIQLNDYRRFITADSLTAHFLDSIYRPPKLYACENSTFEEEDIISYSDFVRSVTDSPVTSTGTTAEGPGSNRLSFVVGEIGAGKSLLLAKLIRDLILQQRAQPDLPSLIVPLYFDFETEMKGPNGQLIDIDDTLFKRLSNSLVSAVRHFEQFRARAEEIGRAANHEYGSDEAKFAELVRTAHKVGLRMLLILDNVDGYHYYYSKYTFFDEYRDKQIRSLHANVNKLSGILTNGHQLGHLGLSILIAARRYVYAECLHTVNPETALEYSGSVYQIAPAGDVDVVGPRMTLFQYAIETIERNSKLKQTGEYYKDTLQRIGMLLGLSRTAQELHQSDTAEARRVIALVRNLCHHGNRGLVAFFSSLRLDYRKEVKLIERFFWDKPHTLTLLYMLDLRKRYSQAHGHFPNLFLVDAVIQPNPDFVNAHRPHLHTYWLKYLILAYLSAQAEGMATEKALYRIFVETGGFDVTIFRLTLGSLATSREFGCIQPEPGELQIPPRVQITHRGATLVRRASSTSPIFCFSFNYLSLIVDDYLMSYPRSMFNEIYLTRIDLGYLFSDDQRYSRENRRYLEAKMRCVLAFLKVLKESFAEEQKKRSNLFSLLHSGTPSVFLDFDEIVASLFSEFKRISAQFSDSVSYMAALDHYWHRLEDGGDLNRELHRYFVEAPMVEA